MQTPQAASASQQAGHSHQRNPILDLPLDRVIKSEYALALRHLLRLYTVEHLLLAWNDLQSQRDIEDLFDTPEQAHHAIATCAAWLGFRTIAAPNPVPAWWGHL